MLGNKKQSSVPATNGKSSVHILNVKAFECAVRTFNFCGKVLTTFLPLIQEGQLSVSVERMCTILVNRLED